MKFKFSEDDIKETNNNGLEYTVAVLEQLYTDPEFPPNADTLPVSLKASGKSRYVLYTIISFTFTVFVKYCLNSKFLKG